jgi:ankyrin repeat protein
MIDEKGYTLMHMACFKNDEECALKLMEWAY